MSNPKTEWSDADIQTLTTDWNNGVTPTVIGRKFNRARHSVIGKAHRLNLPPHPSRATGASETSMARKNSGREIEVRHHLTGDVRTVKLDNKARDAILGKTLPPLAFVGPTLATNPGRRPPLPPQQEAPTVEQLRLKLVNAGPCQFPIWPHGERPPRDLRKRFCGKPVTQIGSPYCADCRKITYTKDRTGPALDMPPFVVIAGHRVLTEEGKRRIVEGQKRAKVAA